MKEVNLKEVPQTMLCTLHNRANEAIKKDGIITDKKAFLKIRKGFLSGQ